MRQVDRRLHEAPVAPALHLVDQQRHDHRYREQDDQLHGADQHRVPQHLVEHRALEQRPEMLQPDPQAGADDAVVLEGQLGLPHRQVMKDHEIEQARQQHQVVAAPAPDPPEAGLASRFGNVPNQRLRQAGGAVVEAGHVRRSSSGRSARLEAARRPRRARPPDMAAPCARSRPRRRSWPAAGASRGRPCRSAACRPWSGRDR